MSRTPRPLMVRVGRSTGNDGHRTAELLANSAHGTKAGPIRYAWWCRSTADACLPT
jgi:hypothetical protein